MPATTILQPSATGPWGIAGATVTVKADVPSPPWRESSAGVGGSGVSAALVPEAYEIARARLITLTLRFRETKRPEMLAWLEWAQRSGQPFTFRLHQDDAASEFPMYLWRPALPDPIDFTRDDYLGALQTVVTLRTANGAVVNVNPWSPTLAPAATVVIGPGALALRIP